MATSWAAVELGLTLGPLTTTRPKPTWSTFLQEASQLASPTSPKQAPVQESNLDQESHTETAPTDSPPSIHKLSLEPAPHC